ncbi:DUF637 domain-containing protein [Alloalcanivorax marinus]|uniref:DUF637 domain-containing protein n=1 Tax=Alloalcanivorax marinus TaxID=1177169 RepID=UPI00193404A7|nr:DUF637 domain-containing protein [Alloalcanivorax marinus]MBL7249129.1 DUF637 domain-containing protein [Alloalcanivorax marinus]
MAASGLTAGIQSDPINSITRGFDLGTAQGALGFAAHSAGQGLINAGATAAIQGGSFQDHLIGNLENQGNNVLSALAFHGAGTLASNIPSTLEQSKWWLEGGAGKTLLHAGTGGLVTGAISGDFKTGVAAGAMNQLFSPHVDSQGAWKPAASQLAGMFGSGLVNGDVEQGAWIGKQADTYNRQLHPQEKTLAKVLAKNSNGIYTAEDIEETLRALNDNKNGRLVTDEMIVDLRSDALQGEDYKDIYFDYGGDWLGTPGEDGVLRYMVQNPQALDKDLAEYVIANTGKLGYDYGAPVLPEPEGEFGDTIYLSRFDGENGSQWQDPWGRAVGGPLETDVSNFGFEYNGDIAAGTYQYYSTGYSVGYLFLDGSMTNYYLFDSDNNLVHRFKSAGVSVSKGGNFGLLGSMNKGLIRMEETKRAVEQSAGSGVSGNLGGAFIVGGNLGLSEGQAYGGVSFGIGVGADLEAESSGYVESYKVEDFNKCHYVRIMD